MYLSQVCVCLFLLGVITVSFALQPSGQIEILGYPCTSANQSSSLKFPTCSTHKSIFEGDNPIALKATGTCNCCVCENQIVCGLQ